MSFRTFLEQLERELEIPQPERRQVLAELEAHLEECRAELVGDGATEEEAQRRAIEMLAVDGEFHESISEVHSTRIAELHGK